MDSLHMYTGITLLGHLLGEMVSTLEGQYKGSAAGIRVTYVK